MAYIPRSSFTPTNASAVIPAQIRKKRTIRVFGMLSGLMIVGALLGTVSVFLYNEYALKQLDIAKAALQKESDVDNAKYIEEIRIYDKKLRIANYLLDTHIAPSQIFEVLEDVVKSTIEFKELEFTYDPGFDAVLILNGVSKEFASLASQKVQLDNDAIFSQYMLHDITLITPDDGSEGINTGDNKIGFVVTGLFEKDLLLYTGENVQTLPTPSAPVETEVVPSPSLETSEGENVLDIDSIESTNI